MHIRRTCQEIKKHATLPYLRLILGPKKLFNLLFLSWAVQNEHEPSHASVPLRKKPLTYAICCCEGAGGGVGGGGGDTVRLLLYSTRIIIELICFLFFTELNSCSSYRPQSFSFLLFFFFLLFACFLYPGSFGWD